MGGHAAGASSPRSGAGSLIVVGAGLKAVAHLTVESCGWIQRADIVLYCVADPVSREWIQEHSQESVDLYGFYNDDGPRMETYRAMTGCILAHVRAGKDVCVVYYGHPGVFVNPTHEAIRVLRQEGYPAAMLPGISAEDYLYAELGFDPATCGCIAYEATDMMLRRRKPSIDSHVILWQIGCLGDAAFRRGGYDTPHIPLLRDYLLRFYSPEHEAFHYVGAQFAGCESTIELVKLGRLDRHRYSGASTLYIPPQEVAEFDWDVAEQFGFARPTEEADAPVPVGALEGDLAPPAGSGVAANGRSAIASFISGLAADPARMAAFSSDPDAAMAAAEPPLSDLERRALRERSAHQIYIAINGG